MISNLYFLIASLFYSILLLTVYFGKKREKTLVNNVCSGLIITNFIGIFIGFACFFSVLYMENIPKLNFFISRFYIVYLYVWMFLFNTYVYTISYNLKSKDKRYKLYKKIIYLIGVILSICTFALPLYYVNTDGAVYSYGPSVELFMYASELCAAFCIFIMFKNLKGENKNKYAPVFIYIVLAIIVVVIQNMYPSLLLATSMETFVLFLIYFSLEKNNTKKVIKSK